MDILLATGLKDSCVESCRQQVQQISALPISAYTWSTNDASPFSKCMLKYCSQTEPTAYDPEWPKYLTPTSRPPIRLDYILISDSFMNDNNNNNDMITSILSGVDMNINTKFMSDHYPVYISKQSNKKYPLY
jgi:hypothetical protein